MKRLSISLVRVAFLISATAFSTTGHSTPIKWEVSDGGNGHFYQVVPQSLSWTQANIAAQSLGGYLATLTSAAEHAFVLSLLLTDAGNLNPTFWTPAPNRFFGPWLGAQQADGEPDADQGWSWVTGEPFVFTSWFTGEPNEYAGRPEQFMHFFIKTTDSNIPGWNDSTNVPMYDIRAFVVEYVPEPATLSVLALGLILVRLTRAGNPCFALRSWQSR